MYYNPNTMYSARNTFNKSTMAVKVPVKQDFPELAVTTNKLNYKDTVTKKTLAPQVKVVMPGYVEISRRNGKNVYEYGAETPSRIRKNKREEQHIKNLEDPSYIMNQAMYKMVNNWESYYIQYNAMNGPGAYEEHYVLPPLYDTDSTSESSDDDFENE